MTAPSLRQQAEAVEIEYLHTRAHVETLNDLAARGKRPPHEPKIPEARLPALLAAYQTLHRLADEAGEPAFREAS